MTVSRALWHPEKVSPRTLQRISEAIVRTGYVPNLVAGSLATTKSRLVAGVVPTLRSGIFSDTVEAMSRVLRRAGYQLLLGTSGGSMVEEEAIVRSLMGNRPAAFVLHGGSHSEQTRKMLRHAAIPVIETGILVADPIGTVVGYSNQAAARAMTAHLIERGCRRIGFVSTETAHNDRAAARLDGYKAALADADIPLDDSLIREAPFEMAAGAVAMARLMASGRGVDAVFFTSDMWAASAVFECQRRGLAVPKDIAIAGFNDEDLARQTNPRITTVRVYRSEIGEATANLILDMLRVGRTEDVVVDLGFELIVRDSTAH